MSLIGMVVPDSKYCPVQGKNVCIYRGHYKNTHLPFCHKYKEFIVQGKTKNRQLKIDKCLEESDTT